MLKLATFAAIVVAASATYDVDFSPISATNFLAAVGSSCRRTKESNQGFSFLPARDVGIMEIPCLIGGGCRCVSFTNCTVLEHGDACKVVGECTDHDDEKRCTKLKSCKEPNPKASVQLNFDTSACDLDLTTDLDEAMTLRIKSKLAKCVNDCNIYSDLARELTVLDSNSVVVPVRKAKHAEKIAACLAEDPINLRRCPLSSTGPAPPATCSEVLEQESTATSGFYTLSTAEGVVFETYCDMDETPGAAWTGIDFAGARIYLPDTNGNAGISVDCTEGLSQTSGEVECEGPRWDGDATQFLFSAQCLGTSSTLWVNEHIAPFLGEAGSSELGFSSVSARFNGSVRDVASTTMQCYVDGELVEPESEACQPFWDPNTGSVGSCPVNIITLSNATE
eukprot:m.41082 g.41082  ORF g.41082 m.41082 type:complete len:394 (-) comp12804_c0_seq1:123-1304(-)